MNILLNIARVIVGVLFIFSGLIKANDPLGLSYKMQEFFEVWGMHWMNDFTLALSIIMIAFEIIAGVAVLVGVGLGIGLLAAAGLTRFLQSFIFGVSALDPIAFGGTALLLGAVALLASYIPARRATRVDPMQVLRVE